MCFQFLAVLNPESIPFDAEELYNAAHARLIQLDHGARWLDLQYRGYCGGCTVNAGLGAFFFSLFGPSIVAWKLVPISFIGMMAFAGAKTLRREVNLTAAVAWGALLCFAPPTFLELSLTAWGNHFESGVVAILTLAATIRFVRSPTAFHATLVGLSLAFGLWVGLSSAFIVFGAVIAMWKSMGRKQWVALSMGITPVIGLWAYQYFNAPSPPFETVYYAGEQLPQIGRIPEKLWSLFAPRQLVALFGIGSSTTGWVLGWTSAACLGAGVFVARRSPAVRPVIWFLVSFLSVYSLVRFTVWAPPAPEIAPPGSMRYAAPVYGLLFFALSASVGILWEKRQRFLGIALLCPSIAVGMQARTEQYQPPFPDKSVFWMAGPDFEYARDQMSYLLPIEEHQHCKCRDPLTTSLHDFSIAWHEARAILDQDGDADPPFPTRRTAAAYEGTAAALLSEIDPSENGGIRSLIHLQERIEHFPVDAQMTIHAEATWRRSWDSGLSEHGFDRMQTWQKRIQQLPQAAQQGATIAFGRKWARDVVRWRHIKTTSLPDVSTLGPALQGAFIQGFGVGVGERWGEDADAIEGIPTEHKDAWVSGTEVGSSKRWLKRTR